MPPYDSGLRPHRRARERRGEIITSIIKSSLSHISYNHYDTISSSFVHFYT